MENENKRIEELEEEINFLKDELTKADAELDFLRKEVFGDPTKKIKKRKKNVRRHESY